MVAFWVDGELSEGPAGDGVGDADVEVLDEQDDGPDDASGLDAAIPGIGADGRAPVPGQREQPSGEPVCSPVLAGKNRWRSVQASLTQASEGWVMGPRRTLWDEVAEIATSRGGMEQRAHALLTPLRSVVPYSAAWIAVRDPETRLHRPVAQDGATTALARYFALPEADDELEALSLNRCQPPVRATDLPVPLDETRAWGEYLLPAGFRDGLAMPLLSDDGRHLGFISLLTDGPGHRTTTFSGLLEQLRPLLALALDRLPSLATAALATEDAIGAAVLSRGGRSLPLPGMPLHPLLASGTLVVALARKYASDAGSPGSFLSPWAGGFARITVVDCREEGIDHLATLALVSPARDAAGLSLPDLQALSGLVSGWDEEQIRARCGVAQVGARMRSVAHSMGFASTDALLTHAAAEGLYLPPALWP
jgi:hypothetical protein